MLRKLLITAGVIALFLLLAVVLNFVFVRNLNAEDEMISSPEVDESVSYLDYPIETIDGDTTSLRAYEGDVLLIVNVASKCGFTPQYEGLQELEEKYQDRGFHVIGFPANNFMGQEPGTNEEIRTFCTSNYGVTFPMMAKISVKGKDKHPLYVYLTEESSEQGEITWNFNKFLLDRNGEVIARFGTKTKPNEKELINTLEAALG